MFAEQIFFVRFVLATEKRLKKAKAEQNGIEVKLPIFHTLDMLLPN